MDPISHIVSAVIFSAGFKFPLEGYIFTVLGSLLPDFAGPFIFHYYSWQSVSTSRAYRKKPRPERLFRVYDFLHSFLFIAIISAMSYLVHVFYFIALGMMLHLIIDIPTHKWRGIGLFFPLKYCVRGFFDWVDIYIWLKSKLKFLP